MRKLLAIGAGLGLLAGASAPAAAQTAATFSLTPHVDFTSFGSMYNGAARSGGQQVGRVSIDLESGIGFGAGGTFQFAGSPWSLFGDATRTATTGSANLCGTGGDCDGGEFDMNVYQFNVGIARRLTAPAAAGTPTLHFLLGGSLTRLNVVGEDEKIHYNNPGVVAGLEAGFRLSPQFGVRFTATDSYVKADTRKLARDLRDGPTDPTLQLDTHYINALRVGVGFTIGF